MAAWVPRERDEQTALFAWAHCMEGREDALRLLHHIPNGGSRNAAEAVSLKRQGVKAGVPDLFLPVARGGFHGLYIEMKRKGGRLSAEQTSWLRALRAQGFAAAVCYSFEEARDTLMHYLSMGETRRADGARQAKAGEAPFSKVL